MSKQTIEEWLASGKTITKIPFIKEENTSITVRSTSKTPMIPMHISEGALFFAERIKRRKKECKFTGNISLLPLKLIEFLKTKGIL